MRHRLGILMVIFSLPVILSAQDTIFLTSGRAPVAAKIASVKYGRVKYFLPGKKNARMITARFIDSVKYAGGHLDEQMEKLRVKRINTYDHKQERIASARQTHTAYRAKKRERNSYIDPYPNRISTGLQAISTSLFFAKILNYHADISAALGTNITYERALLKNRLGVAASGFWSWNKTAQGGMLAARYYALNRPGLRLGFGPMFACSYMTYRTPYNNRPDMLSYQSDVPPKPPYEYIKARAATISFNFTAQTNLNKRLFLTNDLFVGGTNYRGISPDKAFFSYRLNFGFRF